MNLLTADERYVFSSDNVADEATAEAEAALMRAQGVPCCYLAPKGERRPRWRRVDAGLSE